MRVVLLFLLVLVVAVGVLPADAQSTPVPCAAAPAPRLIALQPGRVVEGGVANNLRAEPSTRAEIVGQMPPGALFNVLNHTECAGGYRWYEVAYRGVVGWTVEGSADDYFLEPYTVEAVPVLMSDDGVLETEWLRLTLEPTLADGVTVEHDPGYTLPDSMSPYPRNVQLRFEAFPGYVPDETCCQVHPVITLYPVSGFGEIGDRFDADLDALQTLIDERPPLPEYEPSERLLIATDDLPYLPSPNARQVFALDAQYIDFENGAGVRYVTAYAQQLAEFNRYSLFYTFQGMTDDGETYVSAQFPLILPETTLPPYVEGDYEEMMEWYAPYFHELVANLKALDAGDYTPDLTALDAVMASLWAGMVE